MMSHDYDDYLDDPDDPIMDGSDDEFSDLEGDNLDDPDLDPPLTACFSSPSPYDTPGPSETLGPGPSGPSDSPGSTIWTATAKQISIQPFTSPTGPIEDIPSPMEPELMEEMVKTSKSMINGRR